MLTNQIQKLLAACALCAAAAAGCGNDDVTGPGGDSADESDNPHEVVVASVWKEKSATPGKQFIAILEQDMYTHDEQILLFGDDEDGKPSVRSFVSDFGIFVSKGESVELADNFYKLTGKFETDDRVAIKLAGKDGRKFDLVYERVKKDAPDAEVIAAADRFYDKFDALLDKSIETLDDVKGLIRLHIRSHSFDPNESAALPWQFELQFLQIEASVDLSAASSKLAGVEIKADGSDAISKLFFKKLDAEWTSDADLPDPEEAFEQQDPETFERPHFIQFHTGIDGLEKDVLRDGLEKFAKFTITRLEPFECEGGFDWDTDFFWVLSDGSTLSYDPSPECD